MVNSHPIISHIVLKSDLPFACPPKNVESLAHPKVFLTFKNDQATCPYCSLEYVLKDDQ